jgi:hypothetical protein
MERYYVVAKWLYNMEDAGNRNVNPKQLRKIVEFLHSRPNKWKDEQNAYQIAAVWAYFTAAYNDIETNSLKMGVKMIWSDKPSLYRKYKDKDVPDESKAKRSRTTFDQRRPGRDTPDSSMEREESPEPPGRRLVTANVPPPLMYGTGGRSSLDFGLDPLQ